VVASAWIVLFPHSRVAVSNELQPPIPPWVRRAVVVVGASVALWFIGGFLFLRWLEREVAQEYATGMRVSTDGDSLGIPLISFLIGWAVVLVIADLGAIAWLAGRARRQSPADAT